jgi:hypothetical protein
MFIIWFMIGTIVLVSILLSIEATINEKKNNPKPKRPIDTINKWLIIILIIVWTIIILTDSW